MARAKRFLDAEAYDRVRSLDANDRFAALTILNDCAIGNCIDTGGGQITADF